MWCQRNGDGRGEGVGEKQIYEFQIQIFRFSDFQIFDFRFLLFLKTFPENMLVRYRGINNKGVLERPGTKWKVLRTISSTLKFQECQKSWKIIIPLFGETENWRPGAYFDAKYVSAPPRHAKTAWIAIWSKKQKPGIDNLQIWKSENLNLKLIDLFLPPPFRFLLPPPLRFTPIPFHSRFWPDK